MLIAVHVNTCGAQSSTHMNTSEMVHYLLAKFLKSTVLNLIKSSHLELEARSIVKYIVKIYDIVLYCVAKIIKVPIMVLARIFKMPVQNSYSKNFACPDLATN